LQNGVLQESFFVFVFVFKIYFCWCSGFIEGWYLVHGGSSGIHSTATGPEAVLPGYIIFLLILLRKW
jgi:hypothetical protein